MITQNDISRLTGTDVYDTEGNKIGSVGQVYLDTDSGNPEWVAVKTGLFGTKETFVPLQRAGITDDRVTVAFAKDQVKHAPQIDADGPLTYAEENELYTYYGLAGSGDNSGSESYQSTGTTGSTATTVTDRTDNDRTDYDRTDTDHRTGGNDNAMTRSEERLVAGTQTEQAGKARLRKYVVTEQESVRVPVAHEEVRLEREPITDGNAGDAYDGPAITESEHEVTLRAERPVVDTEAVPVERVRLNKETVRDEETVTGQVRKEQIDFDGPEGRNTRS